MGSPRKFKSKNQYRQLLDDLCSDYCDKDKYCILKDFLVSSHPSPRLLIQMKCIEKFKYELNRNRKDEMDWAEVINSWVNGGHAKKFAEVYDENKNFREIYKEIMDGYYG